MKTILHLIPSLTGGGAERQLALLAREQAKHASVHIAVRRRGNYERHLEGSGVAVHELGDLRRGHPLLFARVHALVRRLRPSLLQTWLVQMDLVGGVVALETRVPWILTERNTKQCYVEFPISSRLRYRLGRYAKAIVANSIEGADDWRRVPTRAESIVTIRNAIDGEGIANAAPVTISSVPVFIAAGRLHPQKAHDVLLDAAALVPKAHAFLIVILGDGPMKSALENKIAALGLRQRVRLLSYSDGWWGLLKTARALVNPSRFEGQPNVVLEAMAARCPVIVSDIKPHREFLDDSAARFVAVGDAGTLAAAMIETLEHAELARERARRASLIAVQATATAAAHSYDLLYDQLLRVPRDTSAATSGT